MINIYVVYLIFLHVFQSKSKMYSLVISMYKLKIHCLLLFNVNAQSSFTESFKFEIKEFSGVFEF